MDNSLQVENSTFSGNQNTGSGGAIVVTWSMRQPVKFILSNSIIANNGANECFFFAGFVNAVGGGNLIMNNGSGTGFFSPCPGVVTTSDPQLSPLQLNSPGKTPTMAILASSAAADKADPATSLSSDQRGVPRPQGGGFDIGAFEVRSEDKATTTWNRSDKSTNIILSNGDLTFANGQNSNNGVRTVASASSGKKYWELTATRIFSPPDFILEGLANSSADLFDFPGVDLNGIGWSNAGTVWMGDSPVATIQGWAQGDVLSFAVDLGSNQIWFRVNGGNWNNDAASDPATNTGGIDISTLAGGPYFAFGHVFTGEERLTANFGASPYAQSVPSGFTNW